MSRLDDLSSLSIQLLHRLYEKMNNTNQILSELSIFILLGYGPSDCSIISPKQAPSPPVPDSNPTCRSHQARRLFPFFFASGSYVVVGSCDNTIYTEVERHFTAFQHPPLAPCCTFRPVRELLISITSHFLQLNESRKFSVS